LIGAFLILLALAFFWALFRPVLIERLIRYAQYHVWQGMLFFLIGFLVTLAICVAMP